MPKDPIYKKFYLQRKAVVDIPYEVVYQRKLAEMIKYYNEHGIHGFLSERMIESSIVPRAKRETEFEIYNNSCSLSLCSAIIETSKEEDQIQHIEGQPNFDSWVVKDYDEEVEGRLLDSDLCAKCGADEVEDEMEFDDEGELFVHDRVCGNCGYAVRVY